MTAFKAQDANAVAALYTEDCKVMPTGSDVVMGREGKLLGRQVINSITCMEA